MESHLGIEVWAQSTTMTGKRGVGKKGPESWIKRKKRKGKRQGAGDGKGGGRNWERLTEASGDTDR